MARRSFAGLFIFSEAKRVCSLPKRNRAQEKKLDAGTARAKRTRVRSRKRRLSTRRRVARGSVRLNRRRAQRGAIAPRQVAVRAQELAFQLLVAVDRGAVVEKFIRSYARELKRPGRISNPGRYRELIETIRREVFLLLTLRAEEETPPRLRGRSGQKSSAAEAEIVKLFRDEFYIALGRSLDFSEEEFGGFCRDIDVYRTLQRSARTTKSRSAGSAPAGPFVDRCGFLLDSPLLDQGRHAAARFESELHVIASSVLRKVFSRRS